MLNIDFFSSSNSRSSEARLSKIEKRAEVLTETSDFIGFGYDYFDNENYEVGYGGYFYDGRYASSVLSIVEYFKLLPKAKVLELGCAKGFILFEFMKLGMDVRGIDKSTYAIEKAVVEVKPFLQCQSATDLPFSENEFDFVYSKEMLPHLNEQEIDSTLCEIMRVASGDNIFLEIQVPSDNYSAELIKKWDCTHKTIKPVDWWEKKLNSHKFSGAVNFKELF